MWDTGLHTPSLVLFVEFRRVIGDPGHWQTGPSTRLGSWVCPVSNMITKWTDRRKLSWEACSDVPQFPQNATVC